MTNNKEHINVKDTAVVKEHDKNLRTAAEKSVMSSLITRAEYDFIVLCDNQSMRSFNCRDD